MIALGDLADFARDPTAAARFSPLADKVLLFESSGRRLSATAVKQVGDWLRRLPCPVIGVFGARRVDALRKACDVVLDEADDAVPLVAAVERSPMAAAVLVQVLRAIESLPVEDALTAESFAYGLLQAGPEFRRWRATHVPEPAPPPDAGPAVVVARQGNTVSLELNRPSNRNAVSVEMRDALVEALQLVLADASIRSVRISGRGRCFSVGGDLAEFGTVPDPVTGHAVRSLALPGRLLARCAARVEVRVHGACIGAGIEFPAFARRVVAAEDTFFQLPELKFGLIPGAGGCVGIARRIGRQRLAWLALSGKRINARTARAWGLVDRIG